LDPPQNLDWNSLFWEKTTQIISAARNPIVWKIMILFSFYAKNYRRKIHLHLCSEKSSKREGCPP